MGLFAMSGFQRADKLDIEPRIANINLWKPVMGMDIKNALTSAVNSIAGNMASSELKPSLRKPDIGSIAKEAVGVLGGLASRTPLGRAVTDAAKLGSGIADTFKSSSGPQDGTNLANKMANKEDSSSPQDGTNPANKMANKEDRATDDMKKQTEDSMRQQWELGAMNAKMALVQAQIQVMTQNAANLKAAAKSAQQ